MKSKLLTALILMAAISLGQAQPPKEPDIPRAMLVFKLEDDRLDAEEVYLLAVTPANVVYKFNLQDADNEIAKMAEIDSIYLYTPKDYLEALDLFEGRKYAEAREAFAKVKENYIKRYPGIPNSPGVLAGYYELESLRKLEDFEGLRVALQGYDKDTLTHKVPLQQLELYVLWDAIRANLHQEALKIVEQYKDKRLPAFQRAQVAYCHGRALEGLNKPQGDILLAYQTAITADAGGSENIARDAVLRCLAILDKDQQVKDAIQTYKESNGEELIRGFTKAMEGAGLAMMYQLQLGNGEPLPNNYRYFLQYTPDRIQNKGGEDDDKKKEEASTEEKKATEEKATEEKAAE